MKTTKEVLKKMGITPKLRLGEKLQGGGVKSTGPHKVKIISETLTNGKDKDTGKPIQVIEYIVEEGGVKKKWTQPLYKKGEPNYLLERISEIAEGEEFILEMQKSGIKNYVSVQRLGNSSEVEYDEDEGNLPSEEEIEKTLAAEEKAQDDRPF